MPVKMTKQLSSITQRRQSQPTSPGLAEKFMNFRFNHLTQRPTLPNKLGCARDGFSTTNASGGPAADAGVGQALGGGGMVGPRNDPGTVDV